MNENKCIKILNKEIYCTNNIGRQIKENWSLSSLQNRDSKSTVQSLYNAMFWGPSEWTRL